MEKSLSCYSLFLVCVKGFKIFEALPHCVFPYCPKKGRNLCIFLKKYDFYRHLYIVLNCFLVFLLLFKIFEALPHYVFPYCPKKGRNLCIFLKKYDFYRNLYIVLNCSPFYIENGTTDIVIRF